MSERRTRVQSDASFLTLAASAMGVGVLVLPSTMTKVELIPTFVALGCTSLAALASLHSLSVVAQATQASSYEAIAKRLSSPRHAQMIHAVTLLPLVGSIVIYLLVVMELLSPFTDLARPILCAILCCLVFPLCLPDIVPHFLHWTRLLIVLCALFLTLNLFIFSTSTDWPVQEQASANLVDVSYISSIYITSFLYNLQLLKSYGTTSEGQLALTQKRYLPAIVVVLCLIVYLAVMVFGYQACNGHPASNVLSSFPTSYWSTDVLRVLFSLTLLLTIPRAYFPLRRVIEDSYFAERKTVGRLCFRMLATLLFFVVVGSFAIANVDLSQTLFWFGTTIGSAVTLLLPGYFLYQVTQGPAFALPGITLYKLLAFILIALGLLVSLGGIYSGMSKILIS